MQNSSTSMLVSRGSGVKRRRLDRCPSWKIHTVSPSVAARVRRLRSSERSGCTTEPVNRNSTMNVVSAIQRGCDRKPHPDGVLGVDQLGRLAANEDRGVGRGGGVADGSDESLSLRGSWVGAGDHGEPLSSWCGERSVGGVGARETPVDVVAGAGLYPHHVRQRRELAGVVRQGDRADRCGGDQLHRRTGVAGEARAQHVADLAGLGAGPQHAIIRGADTDVQQRRGDQQKQSDGRHSREHRPAPGRGGQPSPERGGRGRRLPGPRQAPGIDPWADNHQQCRQHEQRGQDRDDDHADPGVRE